MKNLNKISIIIVIFLGGCQYDPYTWEYTKKQPRQAALVGTYFPNQETVSYITQEGHYPVRESSIFLAENGSCSINSIPDWWLTSGDSKSGFDSGECVWKLEKHQEWWSVAVVFNSTAQFSSQQFRPGSYGVSFMLLGEKPPYKIHLIVGDPDEGKGMTFEKVSVLK